MTKDEKDRSQDRRTLLPDPNDAAQLAEITESFHGESIDCPGCRSLLEMLRDSFLGDLIKDDEDESL